MLLVVLLHLHSCTMLEDDRGSYPISHWVGVEQRERERRRERERLL